MINLRKSNISEDKWPAFTLPTDETIEKKWVVYEATAEDIAKYGRISVEDLSILTEDGDEVIGCSEWMRAERGVFEYIVKIHNERVKR